MLLLEDQSVVSVNPKILIMLQDRPAISTTMSPSSEASYSRAPAPSLRTRRIAERQPQSRMPQLPMSGLAEGVMERTVLAYHRTSRPGLFAACVASCAVAGLAIVD